jgi:hypothetical protein
MLHRGESNLKINVGATLLYTKSKAKWPLTRHPLLFLFRNRIKVQDLKMNRLSIRFKTMLDGTLLTKGSKPTGKDSAPHKSRISFLDLPAELRDEIYLCCFESTPTMHFGRNKVKENRSLRKIMAPRSIRQSHGLLLTNKQISSEYLYVAQKLANCVFHVTTRKDENGFICGSAYWHATPRMKAYMRTCRLTIDMAQCIGIHHEAVMQDISRDFQAFIWECEVLEEVRLTIDQGSYYAANPAEAQTLSLSTRLVFIPACLRHRPLNVLTVCEVGMAIDKHQRSSAGGWSVERWNCDIASANDIHMCVSGCQENLQQLWYCEDFHLLRGLPCNLSCEQAQESATTKAIFR